MKVRFNGIGAVHKLCHLGKGGGSPKDDLLHRHYIKNTKRVGGSKVANFETT